MRKYKIVSKTRAISIWDDDPMLPSLSVYESEDTPRDTGLVDARGCPIYSFVEKEPIGFTRYSALRD